MIVPLRFFFSTLFERCQFFLMGPICGWSPPPHFQLWLCWNSLTPMLLAHSHSICLWIDIRFTISYFTTVIDPFDGLFRFLRLLRVVSFHLSKHFQVNFFFFPHFFSQRFTISLTISGRSLTFMSISIQSPSDFQVLLVRFPTPASSPVFGDLCRFDTLRSELQIQFIGSIWIMKRFWLMKSSDYQPNSNCNWNGRFRNPIGLFNGNVI